MKKPTTYQMIDAIRNHALFNRSYDDAQRLNNIADVLQENYDADLEKIEALEFEIEQLKLKLLQAEH